MKKFAFLLIFCIFCTQTVYGQRNISADVEVKQVSKGQVTTTQKRVCCSGNGRVVSVYSKPEELYSINQLNGDSYVYFPSSNEAFADGSESSSSKDNLMYLFLTGKIYDMGLSALGYKQISSVSEKDGFVRKTFTTSSSKDVKTIAVIFKDFLPVYIEYVNAGGQMLGKIYLSDYKQIKNLRFPCRTTEVSYASRRDSTIIRTIYSNVSVDEPNPIASFEIPSDAKVTRK